VSARAGQWTGDLALLACAVGWGATFPVVESALDHASPLMLNGARFLLAAVFLARPALRAAGAEHRAALGWGLALGALLALGYALQTRGLETIDPARSAFLTAFYVLFTPLIDWLVRGPRPSAPVLGGAVLALGGVFVMTGGGRGGLGTGDVLTLACAVAFAAHIVCLGIALRRHRAGVLLVQQIAICAVLSLACAPLVERPRLEFDLLLWLQIAFLGLVATDLLLWLQAFGQRRTSAGHAAVLFSSEPVWAAVFAVLAGSRPGGAEIAGGALVLAGVLVATLPRVARGERRAARDGEPR